MDGIVILEVPHRGEPKAWFAEDWMDAATKCAQKDGQAPGIAYAGMSDLKEMCDPEDPDHARALEIGQAHGKAVEVHRAPNESEWVAPGSEPPLAEVVQEWIERDLASAAFLASADEVEEFLRGYTGHQAISALAKVRDMAESVGWIDKPDEGRDPENALVP